MQAVIMATSCMLGSNSSLTAGCLRFPSLQTRDSIHCASCVQFLLIRMSVLGFSPAVFPFHLHGSDRRTGLRQIRTRDPWEKNNHPSHEGQWPWQLFGQGNKIKKTTTRNYTHTKQRSLLWFTSLSNAAGKSGCPQNYFCNSVMIWKDK